MRTNKLNIVCLVSSFFATSLAFGGGSKGGGGGDFLIGSDFSAVSRRLEQHPLLKDYSATIKGVLDEGIQVVPVNAKIEISPDNYVDAYSETLDGKRRTRIFRDSWLTASCRSNYHMTLHEIFVHTGTENSMTYNVSTPIIEKMSQIGFDCSGIGEDLMRRRAEQIRTYSARFVRPIYFVLANSQGWKRGTRKKESEAQASSLKALEPRIANQYLQLLTDSQEKGDFGVLNIFKDLNTLSEDELKGLLHQTCRNIASPDPEYGSGWLVCDIWFGKLPKRGWLTKFPWPVVFSP